MATEQHPFKSAFLRELEAISKRDVWDRIRKDCRERFAEAELPHRKVEHWRFTDISPILKTEFHSLIDTSSTFGDIPKNEVIEPFLFKDDVHAEVVLINGFWSERLSRVPQMSGLRVMSLASALQQECVLPDKYFDDFWGTETSPFALLNASFLLDGVVVHAKKATKEPYKVHCLVISTDANYPFAIHPHHLVIAEADANLLVHFTYIHVGTERPHFSNVVTRMYLKKGAKVSHIKVLEENDAGYHLDHTYVQVLEQGSYESYAFTLSGRLVRNECHVNLAGEGANSALNGLFLAANEQLIDNYCSVRHQAPSCSSWIGYKGILEDKSRGVFLGKIRVEREAQKTDSKQLNNNLVLSDRAYVHTRPQLEIYADDVKCTHGATVGQPPDELVFYFRSRGISPETARGILTYGFADDVVAKVPWSPARDKLEPYMRNRYRTRRSDI